MFDKPTAELVTELEDALIRPPLPLPVLVRRKLGAAIVDNFFAGAALAFKHLPISHPRIHGVEVLKDIPYREDSALADHRLDLWRPRGAQGPLPTVIYVHGGGFRILSKDSHWVFGLLLARRGYQVVNLSYRLAPRHPFPAAVEDVCRAYQWVVENARKYDVDLDRLVLAGESAGGNLATTLGIATAYRRKEPYARAVFDLGVQPRAVMPACGILQVSDPERFVRENRVIHSFVADRIAEVTDAYFYGHRRSALSQLELADPLLILERGERPDRTLPPFFATCGTWDSLKHDTERLKAALDKLGVLCETEFYRGEPHAFHAFAFRKNARKWWSDTYAFLDRVLAESREEPKRAHG